MREPWNAASRSRLLASIAVCSAAACSSEDRRLYTPDFPAEIDLAAVLTFDAAGKLTAATPMTRFRERDVLELARVPEDDAATIALAGWSSAALGRELVLPRNDILESAPLSLAADCAPRLPEPASTLVLDGDLPEGPGPLHAEWLDGNCPNLLDRIAAEATCIADRCLAGYEQRGCTLTIDLQLCDFGKQQFLVDYRGELCLQKAEEPCKGTVAVPPSLARLDCVNSADCSVDLYLRPEEPLFTVQVQEILPVPAKYPSNFLSFGVRGNHPITGYIGDLVVLGDRVLVSSHDGRYYEERSCDSPEPNRLHIFRSDDLTPIFTATAPPCLRDLLPNPGNDGFFGMFGARQTPTCGYFDRDGRLLSSRVLELPDMANRYYDPVQARRSRSGTKIFVLFHWSNSENNTFGTVLAELDAVSFANRQLYDVLNARASSFDEDLNRNLSIPDDDDDKIIFVSLDDGSSPIRIDLPHFTSVSLGQIQFHPPVELSLLMIPLEEPAIHIFDAEPRHRGRAVFYEHVFAPLVAGPWPGEPALMLAGGTDNEVLGQPRAVLAVFDPRRAHYLPGSEYVGFGVPSRMVATDRDAYLTLPWEAKLLRVTPARGPR